MFTMPGSLAAAKPQNGIEPFDRLVARARAAFPEPLHTIIAAGLRRTVDYQDADYGAEYLDRLSALHKLDSQARDFALTASAAKHLARAMTYDDVIRVADLKTRAARMRRVRGEVAAKDDQVLTTTEFMHPRMEEVCGTLPARIGLWIEARPANFIGDRAYDSDKLDESLKKQGVEMIAPHRSNRTLKTQDGRRLRRYGRRWLVERYFAWLQWKRRLVVRWEYYASNFLGFVELASITMLLKRI